MPSLTNYGSVILLRFQQFQATIMKRWQKRGKKYVLRNHRNKSA